MPGLALPRRKFLATLFVTILVLRGRVNFRNLSRDCDYSERTIARQFRAPRAEKPHLHLYTAVVRHRTLQRRLRMVVILNRKDLAKPRCIVLGSTDPELNGLKLIDLYASRFQIEFLIRDSKQFAGLLDCLARAESALDLQFTALSLPDFCQDH